MFRDKFADFILHVFPQMFDVFLDSFLTQLGGDHRSEGPYLFEIMAFIFFLGIINPVMQIGIVFSGSPDAGDIVVS